VFNTDGVPRLNASSNISSQNHPSRVFDSRHATTLRLNQSIVAAKDMNPFGRRQVGDVDGLIANDKFCLIATVRLPWRRSNIG